MRSAVQFSDGQVTCDWDDRTAWPYEDTFGSMTIWLGGRDQDITDVAAAMYLTERAFTDDILPSLDRALDGIYKFNVRKGTVRLRDSGMGPFLDMREHDYYNDAVDAGIRALADQTIRLIAADAAKRLGPHIIERTGDGSTIITTTQGTVCMNPENTNGYGSVQVVVDTPRQYGVERIAPGGALPRYVIWDLNNHTE
jgi:hypothetical protein|nr:MAG TPA: hypothetical protein [Caudoviricetes sp.]